MSANGQHTNGLKGKDMSFIDESKLQVTLHANPPAPLRVAQP